MTRATALARGRAIAEAGMTDSCVITRKSRSGLNLQTGRETIVTTVIYSGKCRLQQRTPGGVRSRTVGESEHLMLRMELQLPVDGTGGILVGDQAEMTVCTNDSSLVGTSYRVRELAGKSEATARRLGVEEVTG